MRIGLISDLHGNLPALDTVLDDLGREGVDRIVCLGDVVVGPQPVETLERIRSLGCPVAAGNWDEYCFSGFPPAGDGLFQRLVDTGEWSARQLGADDRRYMRTFRRLVELGGAGETRAVAFHGSPRSHEDSIFATTPEDELERMIAGVDAPILVGGHTHFQMVRRYRESLLVNPGSVGLAFLRQAEVMPIARWAEYAVLTAADGGLTVELRRRPYDVDALVRTVLDSGMPHATWWAALWTTEAVEQLPDGLPNGDR